MKIDWSKLPDVLGHREGCSRKAVCGEKMSAVRVKTAPGAEIMHQPHWHENEQFIVVIQGSMTVTAEGQERICEAGDMVFFPPGSLHGVIAVGDEGAEYYEIFAPARKDHLPGWIGETNIRFEE